MWKLAFLQLCFNSWLLLTAKWALESKRCCDTTCVPFHRMQGRREPFPSFRSQVPANQGFRLNDDKAFCWNVLIFNDPMCAVPSLGKLLWGIENFQTKSIWHFGMVLSASAWKTALSLYSNMANWSLPSQTGISSAISTWDHVSRLTFLS